MLSERLRYRPVSPASLRVLEKLGFERIATQQGSFGDTFLLRLDGCIP